MMTCSELFIRCCRAGAMSLLAASLFTTCFAGKVKIVADEKIDFTLVKTYRWLPPKLLTKTGIVADDPVIVPALKAAINGELMTRGMREVTEGGDLLVSTCILTASIPQAELLFLPATTTNFVDVPLATSGRYNREGTLAVNLIDSRTNKSIWAGVATENIDNKPGGGVKKIRKAAAALFKKYPIKK